MFKMPPSTLKVVLYVTTVLFLLGDIVHSFRQHMQMAIDGDMGMNVMQIDGIDKILKDPFAVGVLIDHDVYPNPNRFFSNWSNATYCWNAPLLLQHFTDPITSVYLSQAILKTCIQLALILLLAAFINPFAKIWQAEFLLPALLVTPFFQTFGFNRQMGIIDQATTYDFFYALPLVFLLLFFLPLYKSLLRGNEKSLGFVSMLFLTFCAFLITFSSPLHLGIIPVVIIAIFTWLLAREMKSGARIYSVWKNVPKKIFVLLALLGTLCAYSHLINSLSGTVAEDIPSLGYRYSVLPAGFWKIFTMNPGLAWLTGLVILNMLLIKKCVKNDDGKRILKVSRWVCICAICYLLLLPLGGYRAYRSDIIRYDTFMPVTVALVWLFGLSAYQLILSLHNRNRYIYYAVIIYSLVFFTQIDKMGDSGWECDKSQLQFIANSADRIVRLPDACPVMSWETITDPQLSTHNADLIFHWNITTEKKLYYYPAGTRPID